jgi:hypothetical protein
MHEKTIDGVTYRIGKLTVKQQFNVVRRMLPILKGLAPVVTSVMATRGMETDTTTEPGSPEAVTAAAQNQAVSIGVSAIGPIADALSALSDEASDYVITTCLSAVRRPDKNGQRYNPFATPAGQPMFQEDDRLAVILPLVAEVVRENIQGFLDALPGMFSGGQDVTS